jgi:hypothetical protein
VSESTISPIDCHSERSEESAVCSHQENADSSSLLLLGMTICLFMFFLSVEGARAGKRVCNAALSQKADTAVDRIHSWDGLYRWYGSYVQCDDGGTAEGISEAIARNLVDRWETLARLSQLTKADSDFGAFVLKHIDATLNDSDIKKINSNASKRCPSAVRSLCESIKKQTGSS